MRPISYAGRQVGNAQHTASLLCDESGPPQPASVTHMMLASEPEWVAAQVQPSDASFDGYPDESLAACHRRNGHAFWWAPVSERLAC